MTVACPLCSALLRREDGREPAPLDAMICPGCAAYLAIRPDGHPGMLDPARLYQEHPQLHEVLYADRRRLIEEWDRTDQTPTPFARVCVEVYRANQRKVC